MRRKDKEITDENTIKEILEKSSVCRLGLFDDDYPYVVPLNYGHKNNALYFHCALEGRKIELIKKNNKVAFEIEQAYEVIKNDVSCRWTTRYRSVMGTGTIEIISDFNKKKEGLDVIMQHHGKHDNEYSKKGVDSILVLKLTINSLSAKQSGSWK